MKNLAPQFYNATNTSDNVIEPESNELPESSEASDTLTVTATDGTPPPAPKPKLL